MLAYRLYFLGPQSHVIGFKEIDAHGDAEARERAILIGNDRRWELWHGAKMILRSEDRQKPRGDLKRTYSPGPG